MSPRPDAEMRAKLKWYVESGFLDVVSDIAKAMTAPLWWYDGAGDSDESTPNSGTVCFVNTGERLLGITAAHVHNACVRALAENPGTSCQIGAHTFRPDEALISIDPHADLAVYSLSEIQTSAIRAQIHTALTWPPRIDKVKPFLVGGWPWQLAKMRPEARDHFFLHFIGQLADVTDQNIVFVVDAENSIAWGKLALPKGTNLGGMSGGPVYQIEEGGLTLISLVGIIYEYSPLYDGVNARPLSMIGADGLIRAR